MAERGTAATLNDLADILDAIEETAACREFRTREVDLIQVIRTQLPEESKHLINDLADLSSDFTTWLAERVREYR